VLCAFTLAGIVKTQTRIIKEDGRMRYTSFFAFNYFQICASKTIRYAIGSHRDYTSGETGGQLNLVARAGSHLSLL
jgi:hypothetical protein